MLLLTVTIVMSVLFLSSAWHKLSQPLEFQGILADYQLLPDVLVKPAAWLFPLLEGGIAILWVSQLSELAAMLSAGLLAIYAIAVVVNLARGRTYISCGCGVGSEQPLSPMIVIRNVSLAALCVSVGWLPNDGLSHWYQYLVALCMAASVGMALVASASIAANQERLNTLRVLGGE